MTTHAEALRRLRNAERDLVARRAERDHANIKLEAAICTHVRIEEWCRELKQREDEA